MATAKATKAAKGKQLLALVALALLVAGVAPQQLEAARHLPGVDVELKPLTVDATSTHSQPSLLATALEDLPSLAALPTSTSTSRRFRLLEPPVVGAWGQNLASGGFQPLSERMSLARHAFRQESRIADHFVQPDPLGYVDSHNLFQGLGYSGLNVLDPFGRAGVYPGPSANQLLFPFEPTSTLTPEENEELVWFLWVYQTGLQEYGPQYGGLDAERLPRDAEFLRLLDKLWRDRWDDPARTYGVFGMEPAAEVETLLAPDLEPMDFAAIFGGIGRVAFRATGKTVFARALGRVPVARLLMSAQGRSKLASYFRKYLGNREFEKGVLQIESGLFGAPGGGARAVTNLKAVSAADANAPFVAKGWNPPYAPGTRVRTFATGRDLEFVRVHGADNPTGAFLARAEEIAGMTPKQIQQHLGLPSVPTHMRPVTVPAGTKMQMGRVAAQPSFGVPSQGGIQYQLLETIPESAFGPSVVLP